MIRSRLSHDTALITCRFVAGKMETSQLPLNKTKYVAISHVWGDVKWIKVDAWGLEIRASEEKVEFRRIDFPSYPLSTVSLGAAAIEDRLEDVSKLQKTRAVTTPTFLRYYYMNQELLISCIQNSFNHHDPKSIAEDIEGHGKAKNPIQNLQGMGSGRSKLRLAPFGQNFHVPPHHTAME
jgi:hypothetical protein